MRVPADSASDGISVIEQVARQGDSPPLHIHRNEDELFHVVEGELSFSRGDEHHTVVAGEFFLVPKGVAHSFVVASPEARWFVTTTHGDYEGFVRELSREPDGHGWPEAIAMTPEQAARLDEIGSRYGIEFVGPPLA